MKIKYNDFTKWLKGYIDYDQLVKDGKQVFKSWDKDKNFTKSSKEALAFLELIILLMERFVKDYKKITDKNLGKQKLDIVVKFLDNMIKLPFYLEWADQIVIRHIVTIIVESLNTHVGRDWTDYFIDKTV